MPDKATLARARKDKLEGKSPSTQAGEFVREEIEHVREGKHGVKSTRQAIAIGLAKARRAGVDLKPPAAGATSAQTRRSAQRAYKAGHSGAGHSSTTSRRRSSAALHALQRESGAAVSRQALGRHARAAAARRSPSERSLSARAAAKTKGAAVRSAAARKAARTRRVARHA